MFAHITLIYMRTPNMFLPQIAMHVASMLLYFKLMFRVANISTGYAGIIFPLVNETKSVNSLPIPPFWTRVWGLNFVHGRNQSSTYLSWVDGWLLRCPVQYECEKYLHFTAYLLSILASMWTTLMSTSTFHRGKKMKRNCWKRKEKGTRNAQRWITTGQE